MSVQGLEIRKVAKKFGSVSVLNGIDLDVGAGEFVVLLGPSGCGKSTLLRLIAGLEEDHEGDILISGHDVTGLDPKDRRVAMVFQSYALYPHINVYENIAFGMRVRKEPKADIEKAVRDVAATLKLESLLERFPAQLSGGQRQRVAIGRAMVRHPDVFLFDEPLSNLDAQLRGEMRAEIKRLHQRLRSTMIYVTHDQIEAMTLADRIVLLNRGVIEQAGSPAELYDNPVSLFAARFIGSPEINCLTGTLRRSGAEGLRVEVGGRSLPLADTVAKHLPEDGAQVTVGMRPERLSLVEHADPRKTFDILKDIPLDLAEPTGAETHLSLDFAGQTLRLKALGMIGVSARQPMSVAWDRSAALLFDPASGARL